MIYKILDNCEVEALRKELEITLPGTAKIYYIIRNVVKNNIAGFEIIVDNWTKWSCIILRPVSDEAVPKYFQHTYICHTKSVNALKYFIQRPGVIDWSKPIQFTGVPNDVIPVLTEVCRKHRGNLTSKEARFMYAWTKPHPPELPQIPDGLHLSTLEKKHAITMAEDWKGKRNKLDLEGYFTSVIEKFDSSCLLDKEGTLLAYICMQYNGSMAMLYVRPELNEQEEYFNLILSDLTRRIISKKDIAYCFIPTEDSELVKLSRKIGFEWVPEGNMTWSQFIPFSHIIATNTNNSACTTKEADTSEGLTGSHLYINAIPLSISHMNV